MRLGLTGGIGSGKSVVAARLQTLGAALIDTDALARALTLPGGAAMASIRDTWGAGMLDDQGGLDRARMRELAFSDPLQRERLEAILHPLIGAAVWRMADDARHQDPSRALVFDIPLLAESGRWAARLDSILVIDCREETQVARVSARSGWPREQTLAVMAQQATRSRRRAVADHVLFNDGLTLDELHQQVDQWWHVLHARRRTAA